jgi:hypothetical protein
MKLTKILSVLMVASVLAAPLAFAENGLPILPEGPTDYPALLGVVNVILSWIFAILLIMSAVVILMAAFTYVTSKGDTAKTKEATNMIVYAAIGLVIALLANILRNIIPTILK